MQNPYNSSRTEWYKTKLLYQSYIGYKQPYTYKQWMRLDDRYKAAALYVQFFDTITHNTLYFWVIFITKYNNIITFVTHLLNNFLGFYHKWTSGICDFYTLLL